MSSDKKFVIHNTGSITFNVEKEKEEIEEEEIEEEIEEEEEEKNTSHNFLGLLTYIFEIWGYFYFSYRLASRE